MLPLPLAVTSSAVAQRVLDVERAAERRLHQPGIGDGVAGVDGQRLVGDIGVDGAGAVVVERQIGVVPCPDCRWCRRQRCHC